MQEYNKNNYATNQLEEGGTPVFLLTDKMQVTFLGIRVLHGFKSVSHLLRRGLVRQIVFLILNTFYKTLQ